VRQSAGRRAAGLLVAGLWLAGVVVAAVAGAGGRWLRLVLRARGFAWVAWGVAGLAEPGFRRRAGVNGRAGGCGPHLVGAGRCVEAEHQPADQARIESACPRGFRRGRTTCVLALFDHAGLAMEEQQQLARSTRHHQEAARFTWSARLRLLRFPSGGRTEWPTAFCDLERVSPVLKPVGAASRRCAEPRPGRGQAQLCPFGSDRALDAVELHSAWRWTRTVRRSQSGRGFRPVSHLPFGRHGGKGQQQGEDQGGDRERRMDRGQKHARTIRRTQPLPASHLGRSFNPSSRWIQARAVAIGRIAERQIGTGRGVEHAANGARRVERALRGSLPMQMAPSPPNGSSGHPHCITTRR